MVAAQIMYLAFHLMRITTDLQELGI